MLHLVPVGEPAELVAAVAESARGNSLVWLERIVDGLATPDIRYACSMEVSPPAGPLLAEVVDEVREFVDEAASVALEGDDLDLLEGPPAPLRLQYLMVRRHDYDHDRYLARYRDIHSRFGIATPGIEGYTQFHADPEASAQLAADLGLGISDNDSVSELHLESLDRFYAAIATSDVGAAAAADEELFVDRANSAMYTGVVHRN